MTQATPPPLQFDRADFGASAPSAATCTVCGKPVDGAYFLVNGHLTCAACKDLVATASVKGSRLGRLLRALFYGGVAGAVGAGIWYGVRALTGYEVGLISILVGILVGNAVRKGSGGRGGRGYQVLAVAITYLAIVSTYVPLIAKEVLKGAGVAQTDTASPPAPAAAPAAPAPATDASPVPDEKPSVVKAVLALGIFALVIFGIALVAPFFGGFEGILGILIIGFGLWEAWKINRLTPLQITGPHELATAADVA